MNDQLALDFAVRPLIQATRTSSIQEAFEQFHQLNPWVFDALVSLARELHDRGHQRIGIGMLFEVLRWDYLRRTNDPTSDFRLNNNYRSRYARLISEQCPDLADIFELRQLKAS